MSQTEFNVEVRRGNVWLPAKIVGDDIENGQVVIDLVLEKPDPSGVINVWSTPVNVRNKGTIEGQQMCRICERFVPDSTFKAHRYFAHGIDKEKL